MKNHPRGPSEAEGRNFLGRRLPVGWGPCADTRPEQSVEELGLEEAAAEVPAEPGEIGLEMLSGDTVMDPPEHAFDVGQEHIHPGKLPPRWKSGYVEEDAHDRMGGAFAPDARSHQDRAPALCPPAPLAGPFGPEVTVVELYQATQQVAGIPLLHGGAYLVGAGSGGLVVYVRYPEEGEDGEAGSLAGHEVDEPEPCPYGSLVSGCEFKGLFLWIDC